MDRDTADRLFPSVSLLTGVTACFASYSFLSAGWPKDEQGHCFVGNLSHLSELLDVYRRTPSNLWAADRSWFVYTDSGLWATQVAGPAALIDAIETDTDLESIVWPS